MGGKQRQKPPQWKKGDRLVIDGDTRPLVVWHLATVIEVDARRITVRYDEDGSTERMEHTNKWICGRTSQCPRKRKKAITDPEDLKRIVDTQWNLKACLKTANALAEKEALKAA